MKLFNKLLAIVCFLLPSTSSAQTSGNVVPDSAETKSCCMGGACGCGSSQTPLGVMTDHVHPKGEWMLSYTYMDMNMKGNRMGDTKVTDETVYKTYDMAPETMQMQMQMVMLMYGLTDRLTLMAMGGFTSNYMTMNVNNAMQMMPGMVMPGMSMTNGMVSSTYGLSDTKLYGLYSLKETGVSRLVGSLGISLPTGSITESGVTMFGSDERLAYMMQLGTGSFSVIPGLTYVHNINKISLGAAGTADVKLNSNNQGYRYGNVYDVTAWASYRIFPFLSVSLRADGINTGKINGADRAIVNENTDINVEADPTADPKNSGGTWVSAYAGLNVHIDKPILRNFTVQCEYGLPVYQNVNGTQVGLTNNFLIGLACKF